MGLASALHPARGRLVDRYGPGAVLALLVAFNVGLVILVVVGVATGDALPVIVTAAVVGLVIAPVGPFTRAVWGPRTAPSPIRCGPVFAADSTPD